jgi:hypothetical protein
MTIKYIITAWIFILIGAASTVSVLVSLANQHLNLNFAVLCLVVGIGLLKNKESSKMWARVWIWFFGIATMIIIGAIALGSATVFTLKSNDGAIYYVSGLAVTIPILFIIIWMHYAISSSK